MSTASAKPRTTSSTPAPLPRQVAAAVWDWRRDRRPEAAGAARRARRQGGIQAAVGLAVAAALSLWKPVLAVVAASVALAVLLLVLISPRGGYRRLSDLVGRFAHGVGLTLTWLLMPVLFYLLFTPVGWLLRARRRLRITRGAEPELPTYWRPVLRRPVELNEYRRQF